MYLFVNIVLLNSTAPSECSDPRVRRDSARKSISRNELWKWKNHICHAGHTPIHPAEGPDQPPLLSSYFFFSLERIDFSWAGCTTSYCCVVIGTTAALDYRLWPFQTLIKEDSWPEQMPSGQRFEIIAEVHCTLSKTLYSDNNNSNVCKSRCFAINNVITAWIVYLTKAYYVYIASYIFAVKQP